MNQAVAHSKVIIHVDIDYFYAQVEEVLNPDLKNKPFGVQQGVNIVTCNYIARSFGIKKWRTLKECLEKCPELVCVNGEDLSNYKIFSKRITELVHSMLGPSERMGLDEHYIDITKQIEEEMSEMTQGQLKDLHLTGPIYPNEEAFNECSCGCVQRLAIGSQIAKNLREKIFQELQLTCSVGIAHNKLLAKLVGQINKPNNQTVLAPMSATDFMRDLEDLRNIHGIGGKTATKIEELGIYSIADLQNCELEKLKKNFGGEMASRLKELSMGYDSTKVKPSGKPKTVGLEDSCRPISLRSEAKEMFDDLLPRLVSQIRDDGRFPQSIKVTVRKYDVVKKTSIRETRQCSLSPSLFRFINEKIDLVEGADEKIMKDVMCLFDRLVGVQEKFCINLVGLCFGKFQEQKKGSGSIASFLVKKENAPDSTSESLKGIKTLASYTTPNTSRDNKETKLVERKDETEIEPAPKRLKIERPSTSSLQPPNIDPVVWMELPLDIQRELARSWIPPEPEVSSTSKTHLKSGSHYKNTLNNHLMKK